MFSHGLLIALSLPKKLTKPRPTTYTNVAFEISNKTKLVAPSFAFQKLGGHSVVSESSAAEFDYAKLCATSLTPPRRRARIHLHHSYKGLGIWPSNEHLVARRNVRGKLDYRRECVQQAVASVDCSQNRVSDPR